MNSNFRKMISYSLSKSAVMGGTLELSSVLDNSVLSPVIMWKNINSKEFLHDRIIMNTVVKFISKTFNSSLFSLYLAHFAFITKLIMKILLFYWRLISRGHRPNFDLHISNNPLDVCFQKKCRPMELSHV